MTAQAGRKAEIAETLYQAGLGRVLSGPFAGLSLLPRRAWRHTVIASKIAGCHETALHPVFQNLLDRPYSAIAAYRSNEGYYPIGLGRLFPGLPIHAYDADPDAQLHTLEMAFLNGSEERITIEARLDRDALNDLLDDADFPLIFLDCAGEEQELLDLDESPRLAGADIIAECGNRTIADVLAARFKGSHNVEVVDRVPPDPAAISVPDGISSADLRLALDDGKPDPTCWIVAQRT